MGDPRPIVAIIVGPLVGLLLFFLALRSSKDAWAVAMLQTAGLLIGGWCVVYALRRWFVTGGDSYGGSFAYFDPLHAYQVKGETITVTRLRKLRAVEADGPRVWFDMHDAEASVPVGSAAKAQLVEEYYAAMDQLEEQEEGPWRTAPVAELGAAALMTAEDGKPPRKADHLDLDMEKVPEDPGRGNRAGFGLLGLTLIPVAAIALFLVLTVINRPARGQPGVRPGQGGRGAPACAATCWTTATPATATRQRPFWRRSTTPRSPSSTVPRPPRTRSCAGAWSSCWRC